MKKTRLALLAGGISPEREVSLRGADSVYQAIDKDRYEVRRYDPATDLPHLVAEARELDCALIILHGRGGEDGTIQGMLELLGIPYQGAGVLGSALAMDKALAKEIYSLAGLTTPKARKLRRGAPLNLDNLAFPVVVKPATQGSSIGLEIVKKREELPQALKTAFSLDDTLVLEEFIPGRELTCAILDETPLPVIEIIPGEDYPFFNYEAKYLPGATKEICPAPIPEEIKLKVQEAALRAHRALRLRHVSRSDFIWGEDGEIYILETNTIPGMTETSLLPLAAKVAGLDFPALIEKLISMALRDGTPP
ncbi:D-alanine--D-alanine ligase [Thermosulfuriphilus ammonigenes]|uniref:D-alanine--D-alanine ligase n=1 Tax=Thermosulfuriphilus ammonigenes TaxID=1936021 RepID=A0A6G7PXQ6_9BACT|nr:D-alanine--D-alanine ligase [Thermosulfuriphilus ammonigenes]MBA2849368.1 D-alanine-D-alanine ligase [Thermosulfuriphilus ammonigenes]QIJ72442.1 D-alanine--D-alanine ligase [Thermosulfuriphilus ammonigenes]